MKSAPRERGSADGSGCVVNLLRAVGDVGLVDVAEHWWMLESRQGLPSRPALRLRPQSELLSVRGLMRS
jgi:hypothetical protein